MAGTAILRAEGDPGPGITVAVGKAGAAAGPDGQFPLWITFDNANGALRPGQRVEATVRLPDTDALTWLWNQVNR